MAQQISSNKLTDDFIKKFSGFYAGYLPAETLDFVINKIEKEITHKYFPFSAESNLLRIFTATYDKTSFMNYCKEYSHSIELLISIAANSNYLTDILVRDPEYFYWVSNPSTFNSFSTEITFKENIRNILQSFKTFNAKANALRILRRKEILRIGIKDIFADAGLREITNELSILANGISSALFELCYDEIVKKNNCPKPKNNYCIISLGKLGGNELNYSSDIDLMIFYDKNSKLQNGKEYYELLNETVKLFVETSSSLTSSGYIYRIDLRLRPYGRNSPLAGSINEYLNYYESRGEDWERQMLIKAGFAGGSKILFEKFINYLTPFIYPSSFSSSPLEQIRNLKKNIERNLTDRENIKLIPGGIRDIEFSVQALQLLNGGKLKKIRTRNTLRAIELLNEENLLKAKEAEILTSSYIFYRKIEHYLQLMNDTQTHSIPTDDELLGKLSSYLGYRSTKVFQQKVKSTRQDVSKIYNSILDVPKLHGKDKHILNEIPFGNINRALKDIEYLREGKGILDQKQFDTKSINAFQKIESSLIAYLISSVNPDLVLQNFVRIIRQANFPSIWYSEFSDKNFFFSFLRICEFSQKSIDLFAEDKELREYFLSKKVFEKINDKNLRDLSVKKLSFILSIQFSLCLIDAEKVSKLLSSFLKTRIEEKVRQNLGYDENSYFIAGLGSFGTSDMTFASDIDLIFIIDQIENYPGVQKDFQNLLSKLKDELKPFEIDCRLRPEGKSSMLAWDFKTYIKYLEERARIWEFQAMCKISFITGNKKLFGTVLNCVLQKLRKINKVNINKELNEMREKMYPQQISGMKIPFNLKKSPGGLSDLDFALQYFYLIQPDILKQFFGKSFLYFKEKSKKIPVKLQKFVKVKKNYLFIKNLELVNQVLFNSNLPTLPLNEEKKKMLAGFLGFPNYKELENELNKVLNSNRSFYQNVAAGKN